jgi:hypothetical protein
MFKFCSELLLGFILLFIVLIAHKSIRTCTSVEGFNSTSICIRDPEKMPRKRWDDMVRCNDKGNCNSPCKSIPFKTRYEFENCLKNKSHFECTKQCKSINGNSDTECSNALNVNNENGCSLLKYNDEYVHKNNLNNNQMWEWK